MSWSEIQAYEHDLELKGVFRDPHSQFPFPCPFCNSNFCSWHDLCCHRTRGRCEGPRRTAEQELKQITRLR
jgi:hypothetical protein